MVAGAVLQALVVGLQRLLILLCHKGHIALTLVLSSSILIRLLRCWNLNLQKQSAVPVTNVSSHDGVPASYIRMLMHLEMTHHDSWSACDLLLVAIAADLAITAQDQDIKSWST